VRRLPWLNALLFLLTCLTTLMAGAMHRGVDPLADPGWIAEGLPYSATLMTILLVHELGHYFASRAHRVDATLPYFIPVPPHLFFFGTMGALIKMKSPIMTRKALVDIGAMGPIAGFVIALIASAAGLALSDVAAMEGGGQSLVFGESMAFSFLSWLVLGPLPEGMGVVLHPVAFAGWIGMFVTMLNLLPVGQLDGGHIVYAIIGKVQEKVGALMVGVLAALGFYWGGWFIWAVLLLVLGVRHPPVYYWEPRLDRRRKFMALLSMLIFILTFMPVPVTFG